MYKSGLKFIIIVIIVSIVILAQGFATGAGIPSPLIPGSHSAGVEIGIMNPDGGHPQIVRIPVPVRNEPVQSETSAGTQDNPVNILNYEAGDSTGDKGDRVYIVQPGPGNGKDTCVWQYFPSKNYGTDIVSYLFNSNCNSNMGYGYVQFPLTGLPVTNIKKAQLITYNQVYFNGAGWPWQNNPIAAVREVTSDWNADTMIWSNQPTYNPTILASYQVNTSGKTYPVYDFQGPITYDITALYKSWVTGAKPNYGVRLSIENPSCVNGDLFTYFTSDYTLTPSQRPKLVITTSTAASPTITTVTPNSGFNSGNQAVILSGTNFRTGASVKFSKGSTVKSVSIQKLTSNQIKCTLPIKGASLGLWNVSVRNTDGTSVTKVNAFTVKPANGIWNIQPGPATGKDTCVWQAYPGKNYGNDTVSYLFKSSCNTNNANGYLQFPLDGLPTKKIIRAEIITYNLVYFNGAGWPWQNDPIVAVRQVTSNWNANTMIWRKQPAYNGAILASHKIDTTGTRYPVYEYKGVLAYDITALYKSWVTGKKPNYGVRFSIENPSCVNGDLFTYYTSDYTKSPSLRPKLVITTSDKKSSA